MTQRDKFWIGVITLTIVLMVGGFILLELQNVIGLFCLTIAFALMGSSEGLHKLAENFSDEIGRKSHNE